jgi:uncharacterized membrane protein YhhN
MEILFIPFAVLLITLPLFIKMEYQGSRGQVLPLKLICSLCFVAAGVLGLDLGTSHPNVVYTRMMITGLLLSLLGDISLVWKDERRTFLLGLVFFLVAQVFYGGAFSLVNGFSGWDILLFAVFFMGPILISRWLDVEVGKMKIPVLAYLAVIAFMLCKALSGIYLHGFSGPAGWLVPVGAALFFISDAFLALVKFRREKVKSFRGINLTTYYIGQFLLALSVYFY